MTVLRRYVPALACGALAALALIAVPSQASACSCGAFSFEVDIDDGQDGVPLDIVPVVDGMFATLELRTKAGVAVDFDLRGLSPSACGRTSEVRPTAPLDANTRYELRALGAAGESVEVGFATGDAIVEQQELPVPPVAAVKFKTDGSDSCGGRVYPCLQLPPAASDGPARWYEVTFTASGEEVARYLRRVALPSGRLTFALGQAEAAANCVEVRERDAAGRRSEATVLCGPLFADRSGHYGSCEAASPADFGRTPAGLLGMGTGGATGSDGNGVTPPGFTRRQPVGCNAIGTSSAGSVSWLLVALGGMFWRRRPR